MISSYTLLLSYTSVGYNKEPEDTFTQSIVYCLENAAGFSVKYIYVPPLIFNIYFHHFFGLFFLFRTVLVWAGVCFPLRLPFSVISNCIVLVRVKYFCRFKEFCEFRTLSKRMSQQIFVYV